MAKNDLLPKRLLSAERGKPPTEQSGENASGADAAVQRTVFTVRVKTSQERNSYLTSENAGIWVCFIGAGGASFLRRLAPLVDAAEASQELQDICEMEDWEDVGANCRSASSSAASATARGLKKRFTEGSIDEESFIGPELGPLRGIIVGPEEGTWRLHELTVTSSRTGQMDRFICRERMGDGMPDRSAVFLTPLPEDAVVYGSGESAVVLSKEEAKKVYQAGMKDYSDMKRQLTLTNGVLVGSFSTVAALVGGADAALHFLSGGVLGILYQMSLQRAADDLPASMPEEYDANPMNRNMYQDATAAAMQSFSSKPAGRLMIAGLLLYLCYMGAEAVSGPGVSTPEHDAEAVALTLCGFLMYKVSVLAVTLGQRDTVNAGPGVTENISERN